MYNDIFKFFDNMDPNDKAVFMGHCFDYVLRNKNVKDSEPYKISMDRIALETEINRQNKSNGTTGQVKCKTEFISDFMKNKLTALSQDENFHESLKDIYNGNKSYFEINRKIAFILKLMEKELRWQRWKVVGGVSFSICSLIISFLAVIVTLLGTIYNHTCPK